MTRRLILMRHAKSSWGAVDLSDHDRPLNGRGRRSANALGVWMRAQAYVPDEVLCSSSVRTQETAEGLGLIAPVTLLNSLYHASPEAMMRALRDASGQCVLMMGHNPGIAEFAHALAATPPAHPRFADYPTCATMVADLPIDDWAQAEARSAEVVDFMIPREITA
ncbi:histidine phosphatase family protein [Roseovarius sp. LXJ103]|uniref:SixA phosphatase family protein n=1 Tax=Roseovarius carneus TaxID=2853164 RepID=UPI000D61DEA0|nr:histidine phosphatase family protein [Roseovarius carneus]MBZ8118439.1 histidine phosphatase family protein [Roseovarius carneus]PWE35858.1 phosphoglycerate mutase [Pelagicola sp. LXJ1103]